MLTQTGQELATPPPLQSDVAPSRSPWIIAIRSLDHQRARLAPVYSEEQIAAARTHALASLEAMGGDQSGNYKDVVLRMLYMIPLFVQWRDKSQDLPQFIRHPAEGDEVALARRKREARVHALAWSLGEWVQGAHEIIADTHDYHFIQPEQDESHAAVLGLAVYLQGAYGPARDATGDEVAYTAEQCQAFQSEAADLMRLDAPLPWLPTGSHVE